MNINILNRPQVPGGSKGKGADDSRRSGPGARGAKNLRVGLPYCSTTKAKDTGFEKLNILTYNVRTLRSDERLIELENALETIKWDVIGLAEVRREGEDTIERTKAIFFYVGTSSRNGVGFLVNKKWKTNIKEFIGYSDRLAVLKLQVTPKTTLTIIQVYAPTTGHPDHEVEAFYDDLNTACHEHRGNWTLVIGDFNAKIGCRQQYDNTNTLGAHGLGTRNIRGERLLQFAFGQNLFIGNSFFFKKAHRRWTWLSPDGVTKNEIDYCLSSNKHVIKNINVLNSLKFNSDHRPVRMTITLDKKIRRVVAIKNSIKNIDKYTLIVNKNKFNLELKNSFSLLDKFIEDPTKYYNTIRKAIIEASKKIKPKKSKERKLTEATIQLLDKRQKVKYYTPEYKLIDRATKRQIRTDIRNYNVKLIQTTLENNKSLKIAKRGLNIGKSWITGLKDVDGIIHRDRGKILNISTDFYTRLYSENLVEPPAHPDYTYSPDIPLITGLEVHNALSSMKYSKCPGEDGVSTETLKIGEPTLLPHLTNLFNLILKSGNFPENFCHSNIILLYKKGEKSNIENYRPISLISHIYKIFIKIIENRISEDLDKRQPVEQAGFRRGFSTTDHLHSLNQILEKHQEYKLPLYLAFVDYSKAFDSVKHTSIFESLNLQSIDTTYINLLKTIYTVSTAAIKIEATGPSFPIRKGVKQGDPLSPKLFTAVLQEVFQKLASRWVDKGIVVGEKRLTNLRFADDIILFSSSAEELGLMLRDLDAASREVGLQMNMSKTKLMTNSTPQHIHVGDGGIEYVHEYVYLGQIVSFQARQDKEITRRTENAWKSYWSMKDLMKGHLPLTLKRKIMDMCILPILTYGAQTWSLTEHQKFRLAVCQRGMERSILGVKLTDRIRNSILRSKTQIADAGSKAAKLKWDWAGHVCRMATDRWAKITSEWIPQNHRRPRGRPRRRWRDDLDCFTKEWATLALDREEWKDKREAFAQQWENMGS